VSDTSIAEDWKRYTTRDKILFCSSILPLFVSVLYAFLQLPILSEGEFFSDEGIFSLRDRIDCGASGIGSYWDCPNAHYIINPFWLLLSTISIGIYGFYLFRTEPSSGPSALLRTSYLIIFAAGAQIFIFFWRFSMGNSGYFFDGLYRGEVLNRLSYLYAPNLIAIVTLAYYSRIKNEEENGEYRLTKESTEQNLGISVFAADKLKEAKELLDRDVITEEEFQEIKDEYLN